MISGLAAAGGLAAALSTADGLLLTISNSLSHDLYYKMIGPNASTARRVTISKVSLLAAAQRPANILFLVTAAFSIAGSAFFPALVPRTSGAEPIAGVRCAAWPAALA